MGMQEKLQELRNGFETAYIDKTSTSNLAYKPQFISNDYKQGKKVLSSIEDELMTCDQFQISVAFITMGGITPLLQILQELEEKGIKGEILTTNYLSFSEPEALKTLNALSNITLKMYDVDKSGEGFHTKGYIFRKAEIYRIIIGSSNITKTALTTNREWNTRIVSTSQGEMSKSVVDEFYELWNSKYALDFDEFYENYKKRYELIKKQRKLARSEEITSIEKYRLQPNSMQIGFITNLQKIVEAGEKRALLISATGTGKTYASAFAMRELGYKRVLFLVHRGQIAKQALESYKKVFDKSVSMGMVTGKHQDYNADYILTYLSATYGIIAGIAACAMLVVLILAVFRTAVKQKNQLGMVMGCGCGMILLTSFLLNVLINVGALPTVMTFLPFLSAGGNYIVVCYAMLGIVLSVYKNKNIYPKHVCIGNEKMTV